MRIEARVVRGTDIQENTSLTFDTGLKFCKRYAIHELKWSAEPEQIQIKKIRRFYITEAEDIDNKPHDIVLIEFDNYRNCVYELTPGLMRYLENFMSKGLEKYYDAELIGDDL